jgi:hypothetical protein
MEPSTFAARQCPVSVNSAAMVTISALATLTIRRDHWPAEPCPGRWRCLCSDGRFVSGTDLLRNQSSERLESGYRGFWTRIRRQSLFLLVNGVSSD